MDNDGFSICLVGAGNMGGAMLAGWLDSGIAASSVTVIDPTPREDAVSALSAKGVNILARVPEGYKADVVVLAVKPQIMDKVLPSVAPCCGEGTVSVSVAAGITITALERGLGSGSVVRAMPNTPALMRRGITVACAGDGVTSLQRARVDRLLAATGKSAWVDEERLIDAVTAVSGSGPAYVFLLAECMTAAGIEQGLPPELAELLARETIAGAGEMLSRLPDSAEQLRVNVTSPNGTTAAALSVLMAEPGMRELMSKAIARARMRAEELSG